MQKILLIEDDIGITTSLSMYIENTWYDLVICHNGEEAVGIFEKESPDLVLLDINLPGKNGVIVCEEIRRQSETPIIIISARDSEDDKITLFDLGVDDYVAKPFSSRELMARISAVLKRTETRKKPRNGKILQFQGLSVDTKNFTVEENGTPIPLTKTEFSILEYLIKNADETITREAIMRDVMGYDNYIYDRTIDTHIKNLRKKIWDTVHIETLRWIGYRIQ